MFLAMNGEKLKMTANRNEMGNSLVSVSICFSIFGKGYNSLKRG